MSSTPPPPPPPPPASSRRKRSSETPVTSANRSNDAEGVLLSPKSTVPQPLPYSTNVGNDSAAVGSTTKLRVRIKSFHGVARWTWNVGNGSDDEVCGICQSAFEGCPPGVKYPGDESPVVFGTCGHAFHLQCVATWLNSNKQTCPICRAEWEYGNSGDQQQSQSQQSQPSGTAPANQTTGESGGPP